MDSQPQWHPGTTWPNANAPPAVTGGTSSPQTGPPIIQIPCIPPDVVFEMERLASENACIRAQQVQKEATELAYSHLVDMGTGALYTLGKSGVPAEICNHRIERAVHFIPELPYTFSEFYQIKLYQVEHSLFLTKDDLESDRKFFQALEELPGVKVSHRPSVARVAQLIRSAVSQQIEVVPLAYYAGWAKLSSGMYQYLSFTDGLTHQGQGAFSLPGHRTNFSSTVVRAAAVQNFLPVFSIVRDPFLRKMLWVWFHIAAISSLLGQLGAKLPMSVSIFATDNDQLEFLRRLLGWFGDDPLTLDMSPSDFAMGLLSRKDQPLLIEDSGYLRNSLVNAETLENALVNQRAPLKSGKSSMRLPLQAPITLLSSRVSALSCSPKVIIVDFLEEFFDREAWKNLAGTFAAHRDYIAAFSAFTEDNVPLLVDKLTYGNELTLELSNGELSQECAQTFGIFVAVGLFVDEFFYNMGQPTMFREDMGEELDNQLFALFVQTTERGDFSPADTFVHIAGECIEKGILTMLPKSNVIKCLEDLVIFDNAAVYFTQSAFNRVCYATTYSRPEILRVLAAENLVCGKPINHTTLLTRISCGNGRYLRVFALKREMFDDAGISLAVKELEADGNERDTEGLSLRLGHDESGSEAIFCNPINPHIRIDGQSGMGKSYFIKELLLQAVYQGAHCIVLDYSSDFGDYVPPDSLDFSRVDVTSKAFSINPLIGSTKESPYVRAQRLLSQLRSVFRIGQRAISALQRTTQAYLEQGGAPTLRGLVEYVSEKAKSEESKGLYAALEPLELLTGIVHSEGPLSLDLENPGLTILDFRHVVSQDGKKMLVELILQAIWDQKTSGQPSNVPLILVLDEAQNLSWGADSMAKRILREGRKYGLAGWFASQYITDKNIDAALGQAALQVHFRPDEKNIHRLAQRLCPKGAALVQCQSLIQSLQRGQFVQLKPTGEVVKIFVGE